MEGSNSVTKKQVPDGLIVARAYRPPGAATPQSSG